MTEKRKLQVFVASPGDVADERRRAVLVLRKLRRDYRAWLDLDWVVWEDLPISADGSFQDDIPDPARSDVFVLMLWSRLGTPMADPKYDGVTGTEWEWKRARTGEEGHCPKPFVYKKTADPVLRGNPDQLAAGLEQVKALAEFWDREFERPQLGHFPYDEIGQFEKKLESDLRHALDAAVAAQAGRPAERVWPGCPFRGLFSFEAEHEAIFFGRDRAVREVTELLMRQADHQPPFVLILGASGVGKSSLTKAGVVPALSAVAGGDWRHAVFQPAGGGDIFTHLLASLKQALPELARLGLSDADLLGQFRRGDPLSLKPALHAAKDVRLVLVLDQLEEFFQHLPEDRAAFDRLVGALARLGSVWLVATLRADFFHRLAELPELYRLADSLYRLAPPRPEEIEQMIEQPAHAAGLEFENDEHGIGLDAILREDACRDPDSLPMLEFVLERLYLEDVNKGRDGRLRVNTYKTIGRLDGAIAEHARRTTADLSDTAKQALPVVLRNLADLEEGKDGETSTLRTVLRAELDRLPGASEALDALITARLLRADDEKGPTVRAVHARLMACWPDFAQQIAENADFLRARRRVEDQMRLWLKEGRPASGLLPEGNRLAEGELLLTRAEEVLQLAGYVAASVKEAQERREAAERRQREAEASFEAAVTAADALVMKVAFGLRDVLPVSKVREVLEEARHVFDELLNHRSNNPTLLHRQAWMLRAFSEAFFTLGDTAEARHHAQRFNGIMVDLATSCPGNASWQRDLAVSYNVIGNALMQQGDRSGALAVYRQDLTIMERLAALDRGNATWQRDLSISHDKLGDALMEEGDRGGALTAYRQAFTVRSDLAASDPGNSTWQRDLAISYTKIGDALMEEGDRGGALTAYREALAICKCLAALDPSNTTWQRDISVSLDRVGDPFYISASEPR